MGLASLGLDIGIPCDFLYSVLLFKAILGLDFSGLALPSPGRDPRRRGEAPAPAPLRLSRAESRGARGGPRSDAEAGD